MQIRPRRPTTAERPPPIPRQPACGDCRLDHIGYQRVAGERSIHWNNAERQPLGDQPYHLIQYTIADGGWFRHSGRRHQLQPGEAFISRIPSDTGYGLPLGGNWEWMWLACHGPLAVRLIRLLLRRHGPILPLGDAGPVQRMADLYDAYVDGAIRDEWSGSALLYDFLMSLMSWSDAQESGSDWPPALRRAVTLIEREFRDPDLDMGRLAQEVECSRFQLARLAKGHLGTPLSTLLRERRLEDAQRLLTFTDLPVSAIAERTGFSSSAYLCTAFRQRYGTPPAQWRRGAAG